MTTWQHVCVLCAARDRTTRLESGHCCGVCRQRIADDLTSIVRLCAQASAYLVPTSGTGSGSRSVPGSRPPLDVAAVDPELAHVPGHDAPLLVLLEEWDRLIRSARGMVPYGMATRFPAREGTVGATGPRSGESGTAATLTAVVTFLGHSLDWCCTTPDFPLEDYAGEVRECVRALRRWDPDAQPAGTMVRCPTQVDEGRECGYRLYYVDMHEDVACRRCGAVRSAMTLAAVAMADGREVWLDPEAAAQWLGVTERTLYRMAHRGQIQRSHGRSLVRHAEAIS